jgi:hypothetical protein
MILQMQNENEIFLLLFKKDLWPYSETINIIARRKPSLKVRHETYEPFVDPLKLTVP